VITRLRLGCRRNKAPGGGGVGQGLPLRGCGVEGVDQAKGRATFGIDHLPIDQVTAWALRQVVHEMGSGMGPGIGGRQETGGTGAFRVQPPGRG
jgi:hypothetical protein